MSYIDIVIKGIINREKGFVNNPDDTGGATKYGITIGTLSRVRGKKCSVQDVKDLTKEEATQIYKIEYVEKPGFLSFGDEAMAEQLIDAGVHHGITGSAMILQRALGVTADGEIGPVTMEAARRLQPYRVFCRFIAERIRTHGRICEKNKRQLTFIAGWLNRDAEMIRRWCAVVNAPDKVEDALEQVAQRLNARANQIGKRTRFEPSIQWAYELAAAAKLCESA